MLQQSVDETRQQTESQLVTANEQIQHKDSEIQRISEELTLKQNEADVSSSVIGWKLMHKLLVKVLAYHVEYIAKYLLNFTV